MSRNDDAEHEFIDPLKQYLFVFFTLLGLLILTQLVYYIPFEKVHLGGIDWSFMNTVIALAIACTKALFVLVVFMHLRHASKLTWVLAAAGFVWLGIMVIFTFCDYLSRDHIPGSVQPQYTEVRAVPMEH